ncbi:SGNH/GDSL hydrolase family protein [Streptomyces sp. HNM0574]|uniref:SGNH/GDSL hydrolase family protein n=1 Tax=Streptomyces sp. HNM0574 TaxID=2714954 RepID=UPI00146DA31C|nr:SGNH/GDSL hydrolase family protein [Streptomyces sp. HNM0574]NLU70834.1 SGNH/GDSL hydrolase family protein [Streptomyces sp. HNM0574]
MPMSKAASARVARRIATAAAYGGGGLGLLGGAVVGLLFTEVQLAKRKVGVGGGGDDAPQADGRYGAAFAGGRPSGRPGDAAHPVRPLRLGFLGDSTAAGQGVRLARQTPGALLASALAAVAERPVELRNVALSGAQSDDLERQVTMLLSDPSLEQGPDVCVIMIGANDVTHRMPPARSVRLLSDAVARLRTAGCAVVVGTCPDLGSIEPVGQPLRWVARRLSRQLAAAQTIAVVEEGGRTVSLGDLLGPEFSANPRELFGPDNYHPSAEGYATAAMAVLPTLAAALGLWPTEDERPDSARREGILPVARAAAEAAAEGGTEVAAVRGPWALLKHRRRRRLPPAEDVTSEAGQDGAAPEAPKNGGRSVHEQADTR